MDNPPPPDGAAAFEEFRAYPEEILVGLFGEGAGGINACMGENVVAHGDIALKIVQETQMAFGDILLEQGRGREPISFARLQRRGRANPIREQRLRTAVHDPGAILHRRIQERQHPLLVIAFEIAPLIPRRPALKQQIEHARAFPAAVDIIAEEDHHRLAARAQLLGRARLQNPKHSRRSARPWISPTA